MTRPGRPGRILTLGGHLDYDFSAKTYHAWSKAVFAFSSKSLEVGINYIPRAIKALKTVR
jgi:hypothetical protein